MTKIGPLFPASKSSLFLKQTQQILYKIRDHHLNSHLISKFSNIYDIQPTKKTMFRLNVAITLFISISELLL